MIGFWGFLAICVVSGGIGSFFRDVLKHRQKMQLERRQFEQRLALLQKSEEVVQLLIADQELGLSMFKVLAPHYQEQLLLPPASTEQDDAEKPKKRCHFRGCGKFGELFPAVISNCPNCGCTLEEEHVETIVHLSKRVQHGRHVTVDSVCGLREGKQNFVSTSANKKVTCERCRVHIKAMKNTGD